MELDLYFLKLLDDGESDKDRDDADLRFMLGLVRLRLKCLLYRCLEFAVDEDSVVNERTDAGAQGGEQFKLEDESS